jgi:3-deoxy-manno-octulosonate cytidylyltransferase (CMP-KDO synthetase)
MNTPAFTALIPARLASTRLPDKPLADIGGAPMVVRVAEAAARSAAQQVVVAADDERIVRACAEHGVRAVLTRTDHASGSDRLAQACALLGLDDRSLVVNVQGDEPFIQPALIDATAALLNARAECVMATAAHAIGDVAEWHNPNVVKVVCDAMQHALYFSRAPIAHWRDAPRALGPGAPQPAALPEPPPLRHIGLYAYRVAFLKRFPTLAVAPIERIEALEQLRVLWHGERIAVHLAAEAPGPGVDTPQDLAAARALWADRDAASGESART